MMIKVALVLCAIVATSMVCAKDFEEQDALDALLNMMLPEEVASPDDAVALQGWFKKTFHKVSHAVKSGIHAGQRGCSALGFSPEEARVKILTAIPEMREEDLSEEDLRGACAAAHALGR
uniref:Centrocin 1a n=1 Tax=Strongylocentrotus droebachiensis TaxID=7671 RepID=D8WN02_STRDR|nr:centrocin 1a [Strongylocentrotus droebachiensis]ADI95438.1 centrocin 1a [Strongylocentrotus droebachiensis]